MIRVQGKIDLKTSLIKQTFFFKKKLIVNKKAKINFFKTHRLITRTKKTFAIIPKPNQNK